MKFDEIFPNTLKALRLELGLETSDIRRQVELMVPSMTMVKVCRAQDFDFFQPAINAGGLSVKQMHHAANRYLLGKTKSQQPIFWMIDDIHRPLDAHIGDTWISQLLKKREPLIQRWRPQHCLFGLHLLTTIPAAQTYPIAIVESEASAVILSELIPEFIWLSYATTTHLTPELFAPLRGCSVTLFPRTDPYFNTFLFFHDLATAVRQYIPSIDISVDETLEKQATEEQKERCIDILDFILEQ